MADDELAAAQARIRELEAQVAGLYRALSDRAESLPNILPTFYRREEVPSFDGSAEAPVDLVLTVKDTYDLLVPCLDSLFANTDVPFRLFLNDNVSRDPRTPELLLRTRDRHPDRVTVFLQEEDLGFIDAVNLMLRETANDVILVNADTVLPPGWAARMLWPIRHSGQKVASCTPFSNAGTITAFPFINRDRDLFEGMALNDLDAVFQRVKPTANPSMPVGVGFCMAMSRAALDDLGLLDADTFRPGYGEETDWTYRAFKKGYRNCLVANLFIYHKHGATFGRHPTMDRAKLIAEHDVILKKRHPDLENAVHAFNDDPSCQAQRSFLLFLASVAAGNGLEVVFADGDAPANRHDAGAPLLRVDQDPATGEYRLHFTYREYECRFTSPNLNWVVKALYRVRVVKLTVEKLSPRADRDKTMRALGRLAEHLAISVRCLEAEETR